ncbi:hypothetical protein ABXJ76_15590 [Methylobacter sp. G7]|uniref:hypothetical protein n=1 Tax=Methylobacter sp. G7 TaxID=3230117 RepID=UPI003D802E9C
MGLHARLSRLEYLVPPAQENRYIFTTRAGFDNSQITGFKYKELDVARAVGESLEILKDRAAVLFAENNPAQDNFFIQSLYDRRFTNWRNNSG